MNNLIERLQMLAEKRGALAEISRSSGLAYPIIWRIANGKQKDLMYLSAMKLHSVIESYEAAEIARLRELESRIPVTMEVRKNSSEELAV